jgi:hypothetical protein
MFGWFRSKPTCPVDGPTRQWIDTRWTWLEDQFGADFQRNRRVILPRPEFFPDPFHSTDADARRMLDRVSGYMDIKPATVELALYAENNPGYEGRWHSEVALPQSQDGRYLIWVEVANLHDPLALVATMARQLAVVHLYGQGLHPDDADDHQPLSELLTVLLGMGVITANAVIRENYWQSGQMSGWSMGRRSYLEMSAFGYALARFARARGENGASWGSELRLDVRSAFEQSIRLLAEESDSKKK